MAQTEAREKRLNKEELKKLLRTEVPRFLKKDPEIRAIILELASQKFMNKEEAESRFDKVLAEIKAMREESERKWAEDKARWEEEKVRWREQEKRWQELWKDWERKWEEQNAKWQEQQKRWEEQNAKWEEDKKRWEEEKIKWEEQQRRWERLWRDLELKWDEDKTRWEEQKVKWLEQQKRWEEQKAKWEEQQRRWEELQKDRERRWEELQKDRERRWEELQKDRERRWEELQRDRERRWEEARRRWEELEKDRNRLLEEIKLIHRKHEISIGALGARWGLRAEASFRNAIKGILEESFPVKVERFVVFDEEGVVFGRPEQVEVDMLIKDGVAIGIEIKSSVSKPDVFSFLNRIKVVELKQGLKLSRKIIISPMVDSKAMEFAKENGIEVFGYPEEVELEKLFA